MAAQDEQQPTTGSRRRLLAGYAVAGVLALGLVAAIALIGIGGDEDSPDADSYRAARIDLNTGVIDDKAPDDRDGAPTAAAPARDLARAADQAGCELTEDLRDEGNTHLPPGTPAPEYGTNPATSGNHYPEPQADGAYLETISPTRYIHALEHGRIAVAYSPELPEEAQLELKGLLEADPGAMILFPDEGVGAEVAAAAWTRLLSCAEYRGAETISVLLAFRDRWRGRGPERLAY